MFQNAQSRVRRWARAGRGRRGQSLRIQIPGIPLQREPEGKSHGIKFSPAGVGAPEALGGRVDGGSRGEVVTGSVVGMPLTKTPTPTHYDHYVATNAPLAPLVPSYAKLRQVTPSYASISMHFWAAAVADCEEGGGYDEGGGGDA